MATTGRRCRPSVQNGLRGGHNASMTGIWISHQHGVHLAGVFAQEIHRLLPIAAVHHLGALALQRAGPPAR